MCEMIKQGGRTNATTPVPVPKYTVWYMVCSCVNVWWFSCKYKVAHTYYHEKNQTYVNTVLVADLFRSRLLWKS